MGQAAWLALGTGAWMGLWWVGSVLEPAVVALLPLAIFPLAGVMPSKRVSTAYADHFVMLMLGGFLMAAAVERSGLHRRVALGVVRGVGTSPRRLVVAVGLATAVLSMWISNTATVLMLLPVVVGIADQAAAGASPAGARRHAEALLLALAWGASIGGTVTPIGTPPNAVFLGVVDEIVGGGRAPDFGRWVVGVLPVSAALLAVALGLCVAWLRGVEDGGGDGAGVLDEAWRALGPMRPAERRTAWIFGLVALAWMTRRGLAVGAFHVPGWQSALGLGHGVGDETVAIVGALAMFVVGDGQGRRLLRWRDAEAIPWGVLILFGGGIALARALQHTGASTALGTVLGRAVVGPGWLVATGVALAVTFLTELTSNTATTTALLPVLGAAATASGVDPFLLMVPATLSASCAFMLPVATPPNAVVLGSGRLEPRVMMRLGLVLNLVGALVVGWGAWAWTVHVFAR